jgi:hypothetical protein
MEADLLIDDVRLVAGEQCHDELHRTAAAAPRSIAAATSPAHESTKP